MTKTLADLIDEKLDVTIERDDDYDVDASPNEDKEWLRSANHYQVTLEYQGRSLTTEYHTGSAWTKDPSPALILGNMLEDAEGVEYESFEGWASNYGYDEDSRTAERIYKSIEAQAAELKALLGDEYEDFAQADGDE